MSTQVGTSVEDRFRQVLDRLVGMSERGYYNPYEIFQWPDALVDDAYWMTPELMIEHGTAVAGELSETQLKALSKWESVNFYSLNVHGIKELLFEVVGRIHTADFRQPSEYFHHIIGEENDHMWFFATFCNKYGGKIYPRRATGFPGGPPVPAADHFLVFSRLLIFEELVDVFNQRMADDERLDPTIRQVNAVHHQDESRHIAFGRQIVSLLYERLKQTLTADELAALGGYLKRYMRACVDSLCDPAVYRDAGLDRPYEIRRRVMADPAYQENVQRILHRTTSFMAGAGIIEDERIPAL
jgi:hypothetical protein